MIKWCQSIFVSNISGKFALTPFIRPIIYPTPYSDNYMNQDAHPVFWWYIKVVCGFLLIAGIFVRFFMDVATPLFLLPDIVPQGLVILGGTIFIYHYVLLKKHSQTLRAPLALVKNRCLYKYIRHPMYFGDMVMYTGFALFFPHPVIFLISFIGCLALYKQAWAEDRYLSGKFADEHKTWVASTRLIFPGL